MYIDYAIWYLNEEQYVRLETIKEIIDDYVYFNSPMHKAIRRIVKIESSH